MGEAGPSSRLNLAWSELRGKAQHLSVRWHESINPLTSPEDAGRLPKRPRPKLGWPKRQQDRVYAAFFVAGKCVFCGCPRRCPDGRSHSTNLTRRKPMQGLVSLHCDNHSSRITCWVNPRYVG